MPVLNNTQKLVNLGVAPTLARELTRQITANTGNSRRLKELALGGNKLCDYVATSITTGPMNAVQATRLGMDTVVAKFLTTLVNT